MWRCEFNRRQLIRRCAIRNSGAPIVAPNEGDLSRVAGALISPRVKLLQIRQLVFDVAAATPGVGDIEETLKWRQPSYLTSQTKSGSLIRIDQLKKRDDACGVFFHCQTTLVDTFREMYRDVLTFDGNRCIVFSTNDVLRMDALCDCIALALTYQLRKRAT